MLEGAMNCIQSRLYCGNILNLLVHVFIVYMSLFLKYLFMLFDVCVLLESS